MANNASEQNMANEEACGCSPYRSRGRNVAEDFSICGCCHYRSNGCAGSLLIASELFHFLSPSLADALSLSLSLSLYPLEKEGRKKKMFRKETSRRRRDDLRPSSSELKQLRIGDSAAMATRTSDLDATTQFPLLSALSHLLRRL